jgi:hypothetical protein
MSQSSRLSFPLEEDVSDEEFAERPSKRPRMDEEGAEERDNGEDADAQRLHSLVHSLGEKPDGIDNTLDEDTLRDLLAILVAWWTENFKPHQTDRVAVAIERFHLQEQFESGSLSMADVEKAYKKELFKWVRLQHAFRMRGMLETAGQGAVARGAGIEDLGGNGYAEDFARVMNSVARFYEVLQADMRLRRTLDPTIDAGCPTTIDPFGYMPLDEKKLDTHFQRFLIYLLRQLHSKGYRRYNESCYEQVVSPPVVGYSGGETSPQDDAFEELRRYPTHAWRRVCDIKEFVLDAAAKEDKFEQWKAMTMDGNLNKACEYLKVCREAEFPQLQPDRHWHSFHNGIYCTDTANFYLWGDPSIPVDSVACKYHQMNFDASIMELEWYDVPTPYIHSVLDYQLRDLPGDERTEVIMWVYVFLGRLLFDVGEKDAWQVILFVVGLAGTGKSTLLKAAGWFFEEEDVETLSNEGRKGDGGLMTFVNKFLWRCFEVKQNFSLDQAQFQSMVSGEPMSITRLFAANVSVTWKVPGILAGNEVAGWTDNSGSISRRIVLLNFARRVDSTMKDPHLEKKIQMEIGNLLHKACSAYLGAVRMYGDKDIWATFVDESGTEQPVLPKYFHMQKTRLQSLTQPLVSFLRNGPNLVYGVPGAGLCMPYDRFKELARMYIESNNLGKFSWREDKVKGPMEEFGLVVKERKESAEYRGRVLPRNTQWVFGVCEQDEAMDAVMEAAPETAQDELQF